MRGLAAIAVLACHYTSECSFVGRLDESWVFRLGSYGPHLFFIISGFVILLSLHRCRGAVEFAFLRFARLFPTYWFGVVLSTVVLISVANESVAPPTIKQFVGNLTMLQTWLRIPNIEESYWTLGVELKFYGLAFLLIACGKLKQVELLSCLWLLVVASFHYLDLLFGLPNALGTPLIVDFAHLFAAGVMFYRIREAGHSLLRNTVILLAVPMQAVAEGIESAIVVAFFLAVFYAFISGGLRWLITRPLQFLGNISYPLYIVHGSIGIASIHILADGGAPLWALIAVPTFITFGAATLLHEFWEKPSGSVLRSWWKQRHAFGRFRTATSDTL